MNKHKIILNVLTSSMCGRDGLSWDIYTIYPLDGGHLVVAKGQHISVRVVALRQDHRLATVVRMLKHLPQACT